MLADDTRPIFPVWIWKSPTLAFWFVTVVKPVPICIIADAAVPEVVTLNWFPPGLDPVPTLISKFEFSPDKSKVLLSPVWNVIAFPAVNNWDLSGTSSSKPIKSFIEEGEVEALGTLKINLSSTPILIFDNPPRSVW